jgi:hypothetical protein
MTSTPFEQKGLSPKPGPLRPVFVFLAPLKNLS